MENFQHSLFDHLVVKGVDNPGSQIIVLILPALGAPIKLYKRLYQGIFQAGLSVALMNFRGEGLLKKEQLISEGNFGYSIFWPDL